MPGISVAAGAKDSQQLLPLLRTLLSPTFGDSPSLTRYVGNTYTSPFPLF